MTSDHELWGDAVGAYVLGALEADERAAFEEHLRECERCAAEVVDLAPIPALLARVPIEDVLDESTAAVGAAPVERVVEAVRAHVSRTDRSRRRWRAVAAVAVAALLGGIAGLAVWSGGDDGDVELADRGVPLVVSAPSGVVGEVVADPRSWGTYVHLSVDGLPERDRYEVWVVDRGGSWHHAGTWGPSDGGEARLGASSHVVLAEIEQVVVTSASRSDELLSARPLGSAEPSGQSSRE